MTAITGTPQGVNDFQDFFEHNYKAELLESARKGLNHLTIDFSKLAQHSPDLADDLLERPEEVLKMAEMAVLQFDLPGQPSKFHVRIVNLPASESRDLGSICSADLGKLITIRGSVTYISPLASQCTSARFGCPSCENVIPVLQVENVWKEPTMCSCGRKGKFKKLDKVMADSRLIGIQELPENLEPMEAGARRNVILMDDLARDRSIVPGVRLEIVGIVKELPTLVNRVKSTLFEFTLHALSVRNDVLKIDTTITPDEEKLYESLRETGNVPKAISEILFKDIYGYDDIKEALVLQLFSGGRDQNKRRAWLHVLIIGDPGTGKTDMCLKDISAAPFGGYVDGPSCSKVGLTSSLEKDVNGRYQAYGGALCRYSGGVLFIDELDKTSIEVQQGLAHPMETGKVISSKVLPFEAVAETPVLATANWKVTGSNQKVDDSTVEVASFLRDRFDLIFKTNDIPDQKRDLEVAKTIVNRTTSGEEETTSGEKPTTSGVNTTTSFQYNTITYSIKSIIKYIYLMKSRIVQPLPLSRRLCTKLPQFYVDMRQASTCIAWEGKQISPRYMGSVINCARAYAVSRDGDSITERDIQKAQDLLSKSLNFEPQAKEGGAK